MWFVDSTFQNATSHVMMSHCAITFHINKLKQSHMCFPSHSEVASVAGSYFMCYYFNVCIYSLSVFTLFTESPNSKRLSIKMIILIMEIKDIRLSSSRIWQQPIKRDTWIFAPLTRTATAGREEGGREEWTRMGGKKGGEVGSGEGYPFSISSYLGVSLF